MRGVGAAAAMALVSAVASGGTAAAQAGGDGPAARAEQAAPAGTAPAATSPSAAEGSEPAASDRARIRERLRAFYFDLGRKDWVAVGADVLPAKIFASRSGTADADVEAPAEARELTPASGGPRCAPLTVAARAESATISIDGDWADVSVPSCGGAAIGADGFRLVRSGGRWRFVSFDLFDGGPGEPPDDPPPAPADPGDRRAVSSPEGGR